MPKPLLRPKEQNHTETLLSAAGPVANQKSAQNNILLVNRMLRKNRSDAYMKAIRRLDTGGHVQNRQAVQELVNDIKNEFPEIAIEGILLGIVATCYLGRPYEVHSLDLSGEIITHYEAGHPMPGQLEKARSLAMRGGYEFIEVYVDCCRAVSSTGAVSVIPN